MTYTTRRKFISDSSKVGLGIILAGSALSAKAGSAKPKGKIGVVLMGLGGFAKDSIAPEIASSKHVWFAGVITGDPEGKGKEWARKYGFPEKNIFSYDQIPNIKYNKDIDFVHIVTPNGLHAKHAVAVARAGKHILCEKPMATNSAECKVMIDECKKAGVLLGINYRLHWEPHHLKMMELTKDKTYGELKNIVTDFSWLRGDYKPWLLDKKLSGGGAFFDTGVYTVQAGCYLTGKSPVKVTAVANSTRAVYKPGIEETMSAIFEFPDGVVMSSRASYSCNNNICIVSSEKGTFSAEQAVFGQSTNGNPRPKSIRLPNGQIFKAIDTLQLAVIHDAFAEAILNKSAFKTPGEMGLRDILITEAVYRSAVSGKTETIEYA
jgi:glucose-fructose oxidoreductase